MADGGTQLQGQTVTTKFVADTNDSERAIERIEDRLKRLGDTFKDSVDGVSKKFNESVENWQKGVDSIADSLAKTKRSSDQYSVYDSGGSGSSDTSDDREMSRLIRDMARDTSELLDVARTIRDFLISTSNS